MKPRHLDPRGSGAVAPDAALREREGPREGQSVQRLHGGRHCRAASAQFHCRTWAVVLSEPFAA